MQHSETEASPSRGGPKREGKTGQPPDLEAERARWDELVGKIRAADADAAGIWVEQQWRSVWLLLRRRIGASATPDLARTALAEAVAPIRKGEIGKPSDLVAWLDGFARQFERPATLDEIAREAEDDGFAVSRLVDALRAASPKQREALRRHYLDGQPLELAGHELSIDQAQLLALQTRLRALVSRKPRVLAIRAQRTAGAA